MPQLSKIARFAAVTGLFVATSSAIADDPLLPQRHYYLAGQADLNQPTPPGPGSGDPMTDDETNPNPNPVGPMTGVPSAPGQPVPLPPQPQTTPNRNPNSRSTSVSQSDTLARASNYRSSRFRLASVPNMFGDYGMFNGEILYNGEGAYEGNGMSSAPLAAGLRTLKIAENNKPVPVDRIYFNYNHFANAYTFQSEDGQQLNGGQPTGNPYSGGLDRYVLGVEKTFHDGEMSLDIRFPLAGDKYFGGSSGDFGVATGDVGNLQFILKGLLYNTGTCAFTAGLGVSLPTGSDVDGFAQNSNFQIRNEAVHLQPYVAVIASPQSGTCFCQGFLQFDFDANGNSILVDGNRAGVLQDQTFMLVDIAAGCWLYHEPDANIFTGLAVVGEVHHFSTLQNSDHVAVGDVFNPDLAAPNVNLLFDNRQNQRDVTNLTFGLHMEFNSQTTVRVGGSFPLTGAEERFYDGEFLLQINHYYGSWFGL